MENPERIEAIRQKHGLSKLYLIQEKPEEKLFGARAENPALVDWYPVREEIARTLGWELDTVKILKGAYEETEAMLKEIEPFVAMDGGHIGIVSVDETTGKVILSMQGACSGCPSSSMTLKIGIERMLQERLPWIKTVESDEPREPEIWFDVGGEGGK